MTAGTERGWAAGSPPRGAVRRPHSKGEHYVIQEVKDFINKGNIVDLAVAVIMAGAFAPIVGALVDNVLMQIIAAIFDQPNFDSLSIDLAGTPILYGTVITAIINFLFIALAVFFVLKAYNAAKGAEEEDDGPSEIDLLTEIRDSLANR
ncbi:MAG: large conductance mechanosensitive channel protein MscL [Acidimicrobiales bacterium]